jgi:hypothetical protein
MTIIAKPVRKNQYWILRQGDKKVGNIEATDSGFTVKINNAIQMYKTINMVKQRAGIDFVSPAKVTTGSTKETTVYGYPAGCRIYNPIYEVKHHLPLFTKTKKSKSWFAAGWYSVCQGKKWQSMQSPKLITLQRYKYRGPYKTKEEAE